MTATDINYAMGRLYTAVVQDRIPIRNANALAHIGRIMLGTIPGIKTEFPFGYKCEDWNKMLDATKGLLPAPATRPAPLVAGACQPQPGEATSTIPTPSNPSFRANRGISSALTSVAPSQLAVTESGETSTADATGQ